MFRLFECCALSFFERFVLSFSLKIERFVSDSAEIWICGLYTGRIKDMIIRGGENIYPREIEEFLYQMPGIKDVQVAGVPSKKYGEAVGAFIILHEGCTMNEYDVREFCEGKIARYKIPKYIFFVKEFPMTGSGKIQKFKLKDLSLELCKQQGIEII